MVAERSLRSRRQPAPFVSSRVMVAVRPELAEIAVRLRGDAPGVRGVALVERLLSEGGSPLHGGSVSALRQPADALARRASGAEHEPDPPKLLASVCLWRAGHANSFERYGSVRDLRLGDGRVPLKSPGRARVGQS